MKNKINSMVKGASIGGLIAGLTNIIITFTIKYPAAKYRLHIMICIILLCTILFALFGLRIGASREKKRKRIEWRNIYETKKSAYHKDELFFQQVIREHGVFDFRTADMPSTIKLYDKNIYETSFVDSKILNEAWIRNLIKSTVKMKNIEYKMLEFLKEEMNPWTCPICKTNYPGEVLMCNCGLEKIDLPK